MNVSLKSVLRSSLVSLTVLGVFAGGMVARADDAVVVKVGDAAIKESDVQQATKDYASKLTQIPEAARRPIVVDQLISMELIANAADKDGLDKTPEFQALMVTLRRDALRNLYVQKYVTGAITDADMKANYDKQIAAMPPTEEVRARHILVKTKEEAEAAIKKINAGAKFEDVAKEVSLDGSKDQGGDLGYFSAGMMVPEFEKAAFALKVGEMTTEPVQSQFGFHVIKLEDRRKQTPPAFDDVKQQIHDGMLREKYGEVLAKLKTSAKVEYTNKADDPANAKTIDVPAAPGAAPAPAAK